MKPSELDQKPISSILRKPIVGNFFLALTESLFKGEGNQCAQISIAITPEYAGSSLKALQEMVLELEGYHSMPDLNINISNLADLPPEIAYCKIITVQIGLKPISDVTQTGIVLPAAWCIFARFTWAPG